MKTQLSNRLLAPLIDLTPYSIVRPLKYHIHVFENIMENGAFAPFSIIFSKELKTA